MMRNKDKTICMERQACRVQTEHEAGNKGPSDGCPRRSPEGKLQALAGKSQHLLQQRWPS